MPRQTSREEDEARLRARGTLPKDRGTSSQSGGRPRYAFLPEMVESGIENVGKVGESAGRFGEMAKSKPAPWITPNVPIPMTTDPRSQRDRNATYSAAFRPDFFPRSAAGFQSGQKRAIWLRDSARTLYYAKKAYRTAIIIVEVDVNGKRELVAGINGSFNEEQHHMMDALQIHYRYNLRDKGSGGAVPVHPDVAITTGEIHGLEGNSVAIGSSISFCPICRPQIAGAGYWLIPDESVTEARAGNGLVPV